MSLSTEVQRTLVKSPPELWSELSNPEALARHLAHFGEIRITSVEPETKVEWEAEGASGVVHLKQSGWGTKVTLSVMRAAPADDESSEPKAIAEPIPVEPDAKAEAAVEQEPELEAAAEPEPKTTAVEVEAEAAVEPEPIAQPEPEPQRGFFARLFRRRKRGSHEVVEGQPEPKAGAESEPAPEVEVVALAAPEPLYPAPPDELAADLATELESVEAQMAEETTELLTGVLDRLGAAHHRPFSRG
jgi:hypothetical protein